VGGVDVKRTVFPVVHEVLERAVMCFQLGEDLNVFGRFSRARGDLKFAGSGGENRQYSKCRCSNFSHYRIPFFF